MDENEILGRLNEIMSYRFDTTTNKDEICMAIDELIYNIIGVGRVKHGIKKINKKR